MDPDKPAHAEIRGWTEGQDGDWVKVYDNTPMIGRVQPRSCGSYSARIDLDYEGRFGPSAVIYVGHYVTLNEAMWRADRQAAGLKAGFRSQCIHRNDLCRFLKREDVEALFTAPAPSE